MPLQKKVKEPEPQDLRQASMKFFTVVAALAGLAMALPEPVPDVSSVHGPLVRHVALWSPWDLD
jgi:hypothetical protein